VTTMSDQPKIRIKHLFISPGHNFFGHHGKQPSTHPMVEQSAVQCLAGRGIEGDRFLDYKADYKGQITFFSHEIFLSLREHFTGVTATPAVLRRNVITEGIDLNALIGKEFEIQGVRFEGTAECSPCYWMDQAFAPGTEEYLKGNGGLRARILTDGILEKTLHDQSAD
jgi:MOSC domain-containing protein YiiM